MKNLKKKFATIFLSILILNFCSFLLLTRSSLQINSKYPIEKDQLRINGYYYSNWNQNITIGMDGSLLIVENMTFKLEAGSYSYAYRELKWRNFNDVTYWNIKSNSGTPAINYYQMDKDNQYIKFYCEWTRISVPTNTYFTFILTYNVSSAMDLRGNRDRVYWNVI